VSCWHSLSSFLFTNAYFFRFGKFRTEDKTEVTPDFAIAESTNDKVAPRGSIICDIKKFPNPYRESQSAEEEESAYKIFGASIDEIFKYAVPLSYISDYGELPKLVFTE